MDDIDRFLKEDLGSKGDITSNSLFRDEKAHAVIIAKQAGIVAGLEEACLVFQKTGAKTKYLVCDGDAVRKNSKVLAIHGPIRSILSGERLALNFIGRMSGIASETHRLVRRCKKINPSVAVMATRKTTPGFRAYEKKAVVLGEGEPHRFGLFDMVLIKDNHIRCIGSVAEAIQQIRQKNKQCFIEIEVETKQDALTAARLKADVIMLDNFTAQFAKQVANAIRDVNPRVLIEVSGGITHKNIVKYAAFADRISVGALTHSVKSMDFSLELVKF